MYERSFMKHVAKLMMGSILGLAMVSAANAATVKFNRDGVMTKFSYQYQSGGEGEIGIFAEVKVADSDCAPAGVSAAVKTEVVGKVLVIYPEVKTVDLGFAKPHVCLPATQEVDVTIPAPQGNIDVVMVRNAYEIGAYLPLAIYGNNIAPTLDDVIQGSDVLTQIKVTPKNGGINPEFGAVEVEATVQLGTNACVASLNKVELRETVIEGQRVVYAHKFHPGNKPITIMCNMIYLPVYAQVKTTVFGKATALNAVGIVNAETRGAVAKISELE